MKKIVVIISLLLSVLPIGLWASKGQSLEEKLFRAIQAKDAKKVDELTGPRANVNAIANNGATPLHLAATLNAKEVVAILLKNGAHVQYEGKFGATPLHLAAFHNAKEAAEILLKNGANINAKSSDFGGDTPLHRAVEGNAIELAKFLIENGADVGIKNKLGSTPLDIAKTPAMEKVLKKEGMDEPIVSESPRSDHANIMRAQAEIFSPTTDMRGRELARQVLGVTIKADENEISKAFRKKSAFWHPDRFVNSKDILMQLFPNKSDEEIIKVMTEHFKVLQQARKLLSQQ